MQTFHEAWERRNEPPPADFDRSKCICQILLGSVKREGFVPPPCTCDHLVTLEELVSGAYKKSLEEDIPPGDPREPEWLKEKRAERRIENAS